MDNFVLILAAGEQAPATATIGFSSFEACRRAVDGLAALNNGRNAQMVPHAVIRTADGAVFDADEITSKHAKDFTDYSSGDKVKVEALA